VDIVITVDDHEPPAPGLTYTPIDPATVAPVAGRLTPDMSPAAWLRSAGRVGVLAVARAIAAARRLISTRH
jgi:hypothetical protein